MVFFFVSSFLITLELFERDGNLNFIIHKIISLGSDFDDCHGPATRVLLFCLAKQNQGVFANRLLE